NEDHIRKAAWLFPLYLLLINLFVLPIAFGGILAGGNERAADYFVLTLPMTHGARYLSLLAFIGGFSAATGMIIVEAIALSTMVMNSIIMPAVINFHDAPRFPAVILNIKRVVIMAIVFLGYSFTTSVGGFYSLVDMGLISFEAVALFAPSFFLGLYWKRGTKAGAIAGLAAGFAVWFYTLILPALIEAGIVRNIGLVAQMTGSELLNPEKLLGIDGMGRWGGSLFWSMLANLLTYLVASVFTRQTKEEELQSLIFVESYEKVRDLARGGSYSIEDIEEVLTQCLGSAESETAISSFLNKKNKKRYELTPYDINELRNVAENVLSGAMGSSMAAIIFENKLVLTDDERAVLSESIKNITETLRLSRQDLADANKELFYLKEFSENIIESAPIGIATVDEFCKVRYWNKAMETITLISKGAASDKSLNLLLPWLSCNLLLDDEEKESFFETPDSRTLKMNVSPFKDPSGGHVVIVDDITEKKIMEEQLLQSSKLASIGKLTAGISHEIGNPLASISSLVQELRAADIDTAETKEFTGESLKIINNHVERIAKIVRSLSDFARMSSTKKISCSVTEILDRTINLVKYDKRFKMIQLNTNIGEISPMLLNPDQIQQVFLNLMLNALDAMPNGGSLNITMQQDGPSLTIVFADTGSGIEENVMDKIFDPFFTTKPLGKGTGLGLSICYGIIREHKGTIDFSSKRGEGTLFTIRLPLKSDG
ncbi:MAG: PAS domain-containing protein, partial [Nitrospirae bacterium]|nr:PAS domain-containing protein [Nitrospirota bacterium]